MGTNERGHHGTVFILNRRIGSTNFTVNVHCSNTAAETLEDKIIRLIRNDAMDINVECGIMELPQTSRQSERSAS